MTVLLLWQFLLVYDVLRVAGKLCIILELRWLQWRSGNYWSSLRHKGQHSALGIDQIANWGFTDEQVGKNMMNCTIGSNNFKNSAGFQPF